MSACRVCGRQLEETVDHEPMPCVCATRRAIPPPADPWAWVTEQEAAALRAALHSLRRVRGLTADFDDLLDAAAVLANAVEELLVELPRRRIRAFPVKVAKEDI